MHVYDHHHRVMHTYIFHNYLDIVDDYYMQAAMLWPVIALCYTCT